MSYEFHTVPFDHQQTTWAATKDLPGYAIFWEQGTGKSKLAIDNACYLFELGEIDAVLVVAPNGVHRNWISDEIPAHVPPRVRSRMRAEYWDSRRSKNVGHKAKMETLIKHEGLAWLTISYDAFMTQHGKQFIWRWLRRRRCLYIIDEGHNIKTPGAKRTKAIVASGAYAPYRRLLTGTPVAIGPFDTYSQMKFVDPQIWKRHEITTFAGFKQHFGVWYTRAEFQRDNGYDPGFDRLIEYKNMPQLTEIIDSTSSRVTKDQVLDLPPKLYSKRYYELNAEQTRVYRQLKDEFMAELEGGAIVDGSLAIVRLLRMQQVVCGYAQGEDPDEPVSLLGTTNPLLDLVMEECDGRTSQGIIWARFSKDIDQLMDALGPRAVRYDGRVSDDECALSKQAFQAGDAQWFVGNAAKGGSGLTLVQARSVMYYSNSFKLIERLQSEDRPHRIGQEHPVDYLDFEGRLPDGGKTVAHQIIKSLRGKYDIAAQVTGDELKEWLQ